MKTTHKAAEMSGKGVRQYAISNFPIFSNGFLKYSQKNVLFKGRIPNFSLL